MTRVARCRSLVQYSKMAAFRNEVRTALINRLEMLLTNITECISTEADANALDNVRDSAEDLYHILASLSAYQSFEDLYGTGLLQNSRRLVDVLQRPHLIDETPRDTQRSRPGRTKFEVSRDQLEYFVEHNFTAVQIANMLGVSLSTIRRRMRENHIDSSQPFSQITDEQLDNVVIDIKRSHPKCGYRMVIGHLRSRGIKVQQHRVRASMRRVDPEGTLIRWMTAIHRRKYYVKGPNSLWHIDGYHKLIR